ncbi:MAG: (Fe-S)-binding protein [Gemmatimonadales bacterium]|nr:MAG: (Fe-S)-binding protein [Gemmatimonadales bacterium]
MGTAPGSARTRGGARAPHVEGDSVTSPGPAPGPAPGSMAASTPATTPATSPGGALALALSEREELLGHCVHCGFCLPACPTYQELGDEADSPRGRLHLMRAVVEGRLDPGGDAFQRHMDRCLGCRACEPVCPSGVEYGLLLERARSVAIEARPAGLLTRALLATMASPVLGHVFGAGGRTLRATGLPALAARALPAGRFSDAPRLAMGMLAASGAPRFEPAERGESNAPAAPVGVAPGSMGRVALLAGCVQDQLFRRVHEATRLALRVNGWEVVEVKDQGCCGALHAHAGALGEARTLARRNIRAFSEAPGGIDFLVVNAAGCGALLRELPELLGEEGGRDGMEGPAGALSDRVRDISEILAGDGREPVTGAPLPLRVAYDPPCHLLHAQRVVEPPRRLLESIPGVELVALRDAERCCGGAGIYGITHPDLGGRIGRDKVDAVVDSGCDLVATGNPGCQMQIGAGIRLGGHTIGVAHPVELLAESYRRAGWT